MPGQNEWFDQLYEEHSARLFKQAYYALSDRQLAEDLVNETFLILLYKQRELTSHPNIAGWLSQTLKNQIYDELKSARHRLEVPLTQDLGGAVPDPYQPPLNELLPKELAPKEREILLLLFEEQLSYEEISQRLEISVLNARTRAFRAKSHYKALLSKQKVYS